MNRHEVDEIATSRRPAAVMTLLVARSTGWRM